MIIRFLNDPSDCMELSISLVMRCYKLYNTKKDVNTNGCKATALYEAGFRCNRRKKEEYHF